MTQQAATLLIKEESNERQRDHTPFSSDGAKKNENTLSPESWKFFKETGV